MIKRNFLDKWVIAKDNSKNKKLLLRQQCWSHALEQKVNMKKDKVKDFKDFTMFISFASVDEIN